MSFQVTITPAKVRFTVNNDETVLAAALRHKIDFPYRCQQGVCTSCVCKLRAGTVTYTAPAPQTPADQQQFVYCCMAYASSDLELHHPFIRG